MQSFSTGRRPLYFIVNTSATLEKVEEGSTAGKAKFGEETNPRASEAVDAIAALSDDDDVPAHNLENMLMGGILRGTPLKKV